MSDAKRGPELTEADLEPLLQATASRALDTCLRGARGLAVLGDPRAFGLLLQLSREEDAAARAEVCRALAALDDPRAADRLRSLLFDPEAAVRDAAFTALARLQEAEPLRAAEAGLNAPFEDVRRRGLQLLTELLRQQPNQAESSGPALDLLGRGLNDSANGVRGEAFKAALNLQVCGGGVRTLRFILQSIHADVRREVLTEVQAQVQEQWAWNLLLEFDNDPDPRLREEAFAFAVRKNKDLPPLEAALLSQYSDVRRMAVDALIGKGTAAARALLVRALADADKDVRQRALGALVGADARGPLTQALASPHADVRVRAARALARHGAPAALQPLLALATAPEPPERERKPDWLALAESALEGLAELGDPAALGPLTPLLQSEQASLRKLAARALAWVALPHQLETLRQALQHADPQVKYQAALGLAYAGDPLVGALVFSEPAAQVLSPNERFVAAFTLGPTGEDRLAAFLDDADEALRSRALLLVMLLEMASPQDVPTRCLACLAARPARVRLTAARALERFADPAAFRDFVVQLINDRGDEAPWKIPAETVDDLAGLLAYGSVKARARTAHLLVHFAEKEPAAWEEAWGLHVGRFAAEIRSLREAVPSPPTPLPLGERGARRPASRYTPEQLHDLAFGAYVGLVREQGGSAAGRGTEAQVVRVRQTALSRIQELAIAGSHPASVRPVLVQALGDPNQAVRLQAFDQLVALGVPADELGAAALGAGHTDVGVRGLEAMAGGGTSAEGQAVLDEALRTRNDDLAIEAAKLLAARRGLVAVAGLALAAACEALRAQAVAWLAGEYDKDSAARDLLRQALHSRHGKVVAAAALALAGKKDPAAFDALVRLLNAAKDQGPQRQVIEAFKGLGDPRTPDALLDRIANDPEGTALVDELFDAAASFRRPESADRLLAMAEQEKWGKALPAAFVVSGFDQEIEDPEDERPDRRWEQKQFPRHPAILARLLRRALDLKANRSLAQFLPAARWARGGEVDPVLAVLCVHADDNLRHQAVEAAGWRLRKRGGPAEALVRALKHRDSATQFLAAEGLARGGRDEGLSLLLAAVDLQADPELRQRAVRALGELGDARALDLLLKIVNDPQHALRCEAAEALGHVRRTDKAEEVLRLLEGLARGSDHVAEGALKGLRWLDHPEGWQLIRRRAAEARSPLQGAAVELLGHNDDPATRDLILRLLAETGDWVLFETALASARRLWGPESLEPDCAAAQNAQINPEERDQLFQRLQDRGDARRLLEILPRLDADGAGRLKEILLNRHPLPVAEAQAVAAGPDAPAAGVAAHLLGRAGPGAAGSRPVVETALRRWWGEWDTGRREETRRGAQPGKEVGRLAEPLRSLVWTAGRLGVGAETLIAIASTRTDAAFDRPLRREAAAALASSRPTPAVLATLEGLVTGDDPDIRAMAAEALARADPDRAAEIAGRVLSDRVAFNRLAAHDAAHLSAALRGAAVQVHYQGMAVPHLAARNDVAGLAAVAGNRGFPEEARLGAIEGLAAAASEAAEAELVRIGTATDEPEELRKAAWRGLRRSKRARTKAAPSPPTPLPQGGEGRKTAEAK
jgi:ParB family chromosome partitioning protein